MVTFSLVVRHHARRFSPKSPRNLYLQRLPGPRRGVASSSEPLGASDSSFSFVFFIFQLLTFNFQPSFPSNSFPHNSLSDPHPLNPVTSIFYKNSGGSGCRHLSLSLSSRAQRGICFFLTSLSLYVVTSIPERSQPCLLSQSQQSTPPSIISASTSAPKAIAVIC